MAAQVTADLEALVFHPTAHQVAAGKTVTTGFTITVTNSPAGLSVTDSSTSVTVTAVVPPTITGTVANQAVNDNATTDPFAHAEIADFLHDTISITFKGANGKLTDPNAGSDHFSGSNGSYTFKDTAAKISADLDALVFTPTAHQVAPGQSVTTDFTIHVQDTAFEFATDSTTSVVSTAVGPPTIISPNNVTDKVGTASSFTVTTTGFPTASLSLTGEFPTGLTFHDNGNGTATLAGTPIAPGDFPIVITAQNGVAPDATQNFLIVVDQSPSITSPNNGATVTDQVGTAFEQQVMTTGFPDGVSVGEWSVAKRGHLHRQRGRHRNVGRDSDRAWDLQHRYNRDQRDWHCFRSNRSDHQTGADDNYRYGFQSGGQ